MCGLTCTTGSLGVAISYESDFTLGPIALHFWPNYGLFQSPILESQVLMIVSFSSFSNKTLVGSVVVLVIFTGRAIFEIREVGAEKGGIVVGEITAF